MSIFLRSLFLHAFAYRRSKNGLITEYIKILHKIGCSYNLQLTVLNMGYVALMEKFGSDEAFAMVFLPPTISIILKQFNNSYEKLGNTKTVWQDPFQSSWTNPGFGAWIHQTFPQKNTSNFTSVEMKGLYGVLGNSSLLFGETMTNTTLTEECKWDKNPVQRKCGFLLQMKTADDLLKNNQSNSRTFMSLMGLVNQTLCPNPTNHCFNRLDLLGQIYLYIKHVNKYTMQVFLKGEKYEIVATTSQKDLALGYTMKNITNAGIPVPGIIKAHTSEHDAKTKSKSSTFYTCEAGDSQKYQWAGKLPGREKYLFEFGNSSVKLLYKKTEYKFKIYLQLVTILRKR